MNANRFGLAALVAAAGLLQASCGGPMKLYTRGVKPLNENERKESTPVDVRLFQLKDDSRFKQATVDKLWTDEKTALADDLLERKVITVQPATAEDPAVEVAWPLHLGARFIGMLALYPQETEKGPRKLIVTTDDAHKSTFRFTGYHVLKEP